MGTKRKDALALVRQILSGDQQAAAKLYNDNWPRILKLCTKFYMEDPEATAQDVFARVFQKLGQYHGDALLSSWIYRVGINTCLMERRLKKHIMIDPVSPTTGESLLDQVVDHREHEDARIARIDAARLLPRMPHGYREVLLDRYWLGMDLDETAKELGTSVGNIKSQGFKARERARKILEGDVVMETQVCQPCKEAGYMDKIAHYREHQDGQTGKRVPAMCYYHHLGQVPPWMKVAKAGIKTAELPEVSGPVEQPHNPVMFVPCESGISPLCDKQVPVTKKHKVCRPCWSMRIRRGKEMSRAAGTDRPGQAIIRRGKEIHVVGEPQPQSLAVGIEFVDQVWNMLGHDYQLKALQQTWRKLPEEVRLMIATAGLTIANERPTMAMSAASGSVTV